MQKILCHFLLFLMALSLTDCASIISDSEYNVTFSSAPKDANVEIMDRKGRIIFNGSTPVNVILSAKQGYFLRAKYRVRFHKDGYDDFIVPLKASVDGWYFGNILFGGFLGFLIIDPITGAMFKLNQEFVSVALNQTTSSLNDDSLQVINLESIPEEWKAQLQRVY